MVVVPIGKRFPGGIPLELTLTPGQLSVAAALPSAVLETTVPDALVAATVTFAGAMIIGRSRSFTVTSWAADALLPEGSVAVHVTVVVPLGKLAGALLVTATMPELSEAVALAIAGAAAHVPGTVEAVRSEEHTSELQS